MMMGLTCVACTQPTGSHDARSRLYHALTGSKRVDSRHYKQDLEATCLVHFGLQICICVLYSTLNRYVAPSGIWGQTQTKKADKFKSWSMGKSKSVRTKGYKSGRAEADTLDNVRQDADSRQSAADERGALGKDEATPGEESDGDGKDSGKQIASPKRITTTRSAIAGDGAAPVEVLQKRVEKRTQERDEAMKSLEMLKRKVADMEAAQTEAKVNGFNFCQFLQFLILFLTFAGQVLKLMLKLKLRQEQEQETSIGNWDPR
jgi:hypothetical protein